MATSLSVLLARDLPPARASKVYSRLPTWLVERMNEAYEPEILALFGRRLRNVSEAEEFLREVGGQCRPFDHRGSDADQNFCCEPYARDCAACRTAAAEFARRLGVRLEVSTRTWYAPGSDAIRFTFHRPK
jgi:hypothetical protein